MCYELSLEKQKVHRQTLVHLFFQIAVDKKGRCISNFMTRNERPQK
jgi:hypothetical protein